MFVQLLSVHAEFVLELSCAPRCARHAFVIPPTPDDDDDDDDDNDYDHDHDHEHDDDHDHDRESGRVGKRE